MNGTNEINKKILENTIRLSNLQKREFIFKFVVIGDLGVGKTSIISRYTDGEFSSTYKVSIGADFAIKHLEWDDNTRINVQIWDIAGHERFGSLTGVFYRHAVAAAIVFDLTRPDTFKSVPKWLTDLRRKIHMPGGIDIPVIILANKGDVTTETVPPNIDDFCRSNNILKWFITSAKDNIQIDDAMFTMANAALNNHFNFQFYPTDSEIISLTSKVPQNGRKNCCQT